MATAKSKTTPTRKLIPVLFEEQLFGGVQKKKGIFNVYMDEANIICFAGAKGAGKTLMLTFSGCRFLAAGFKVWSNYPIKFIYIERNGLKHFYQSEMVDLQKLLDPSFRASGGLILLDEYQDIASAYTFNSIKNRLLAAMWATIRHEDMSFYYTSKRVNWVDPRTRAELDIVYFCKNAAKTPGGYGKYANGEMVYCDVADWSGNWTGKSYEESGELYSYKFYGKPIWNTFDTKRKVDIFETLRGVENDMTKLKVTDKQNMDDNTDWSLVGDRMRELFAIRGRWQQGELWSELGLYSNNDMIMGRKMFMSLGGWQTGKFLVLEPPKESKAAERERELVLA